MKTLTLLAVLVFSLSANALDIVKDIEFQAGDLTLSGTQRVSTFSSYSQEEKKYVENSYAFETSIKEILFTGASAARLTEVIRNHKLAKVGNSMATIVLKGNFYHLDETLVLSCELTGEACSYTFSIPKKNDYDAGLPGSDRVNAFSKDSLTDAMDFAAQHGLMADFQGQFDGETMTSQDEMVLKFDRKIVENIMADAQICELVFHSGGGVYGPGNSICYTTIEL